MCNGVVHVHRLSESRRQAGAGTVHPPASQRLLVVEASRGDRRLQLKRMEVEVLGLELVARLLGPLEVGVRAGMNARRKSVRPPEAPALHGRQHCPGCC